jgi:1-acyl-sn-glycerol-3-phosphate acyltransferase
MGQFRRRLITMKKLNNFKKGVFYIAIQSGVPIVPVTIDKSWQIMKNSSWFINKLKLKLTFHQSIETKNLTINDIDLLIKKVKNIIASVLLNKILPLQG